MHITLLKYSNRRLFVKGRAKPITTTELIDLIQSSPTPVTLTVTEKVTGRDLTCYTLLTALAQMALLDSHRKPDAAALIAMIQNT